MHVFVYGTLTNLEQVASVVESFQFVGDAVLDGVHHVSGRYPTLAPGGSVEGRVLSTPDVEALDAYEGVDKGLYVRTPVPAADEFDFDDAVELYVGDPDRLAVTQPVEWPGTGSFGDRVRQWVRENEVVVRPQ